MPCWLCRLTICMCARGCGVRSKGSREDVDDVFRAISQFNEGATDGAPAPVKESVAKDAMMSLLLEGYGIDMTVDSVDDALNLHGSKGNDIQREQMAEFLIAPPGSAIPAVSL